LRGVDGATSVDQLTVAATRDADPSPLSGERSYVSFDQRQPL